MKYISINKGNISIKKKDLTKSLPKGWVLVKVDYVGLCGSDVQKINDTTFHQKNILGHEIVGSVVISKNKNILGKKVVIDPLIPCKKCLSCLANKPALCKKIKAIGRNVDGGFAEYVNVPEQNIHLLPEKDDESVYVLTDSVACIIHGLHLISQKKIKKVAIIGDGTLGTIAAILCSKLFGDITIYGKKNIGMMKQFSIKTKKNIKMKEEYDLVIEAVGRNQSETINSAICITKSGGSILVFGVFPQDFDQIINIRGLLYKEIHLIGSNSFGIYNKKPEFVAAIKYIHDNISIMRNLITNKYEMTNFSRGFDLSQRKKNIKTIFYTE